jgi:hypothetical protein
MNKFKTKKEVEVKPKTIKKHRKTKAIAFFLICLVVISIGYLMTMILIEYKDTHKFNFQSPIVFQKPVIIERNLTIISPMSTQSGMMKAYAEDIVNPYDTRSPKGIGWELVKSKWGIQEWGAFEELVMRESGWNPYAINQSSGACFLAQALPCSKMDAEAWDYEGQLKWMVSYIENRYKTPTKAIEFHDINNYY